MSQSTELPTGTSSSELDDNKTAINLFVFIKEEYGRYHGYVSCFVCIFGLTANIINLIVLTRKHMVKPVNCILAALATVDFLTMLTYIIYAIYFYIVKTWEDNHTYAWMCFVMIHNQFILICHSLSLWFTVYLSWLRFKVVCNNTIGSRIYTLKKTLVTISMITIAITIVCIPNFFLYKVVSLKEYTNKDGFWIVFSNFVQEYEFYRVIMFWIFAVVMKILPCILLTVFISKIIYTMHWSRKQRRHLQEQSMLPTNSRDRDQNRTTRMLLAVVLICVLTETPQGILAMIGALNDNFFVDVYANIGDILDTLVLFNSSVNFILYCFMSRQFRDQLRNLFCRKSRQN